MADITTGLVSHWKFDGDAIDCINGHNGTVPDNVFATNDRYDQSNGAYLFNGDNSDKPNGAIEVAHHDDFADIRTISLWARNDAVSFPSSQSRILLMEKHDVNVSAGWNFIIDTDGKLAIYNGDWNTIAKTTAHIYDGQWNHYVFIIYGIQKIYRNGIANESLAGGILGNAYPIRFGQSQISSGGWFVKWNGAIDDVRIYSRVLTDEDISALYEYYEPLVTSASYCSTKEDYIKIIGVGGGESGQIRFGSNKYIDLVQYLPSYLIDTEVEVFLKFFQDFLNIMYEDEAQGYITSAIDLTITKDVPSINDKYYTFTEGTSAVSATTSADDVQEFIFVTSSTSQELDLEIYITSAESYNKKISILEKIKRLTELHDPDLIDIDYIKFFARNMGYNININRSEIGTNLGELTNIESSQSSADFDSYDRDKYLRFVVQNLPNWYKIKTTKNSVKVMLYSFGLIGDLVEYYTNDYDKNWMLDIDGNLNKIANEYFPTPHFAVSINIDDSIGSISFDWSRRQKVINAIESIRPINCVFEKLSGYADRDFTLYVSTNVRVRTNFSIS